MKTFLISQIIALIGNKLINTAKLADVLHSFTYRELNNIADCLISDIPSDHQRAEDIIASRCLSEILIIK